MDTRGRVDKGAGEEVIQKAAFRAQKTEKSEIFFEKSIDFPMRVGYNMNVVCSGMKR